MNPTPLDIEGLHTAILDLTKNVTSLSDRLGTIRSRIVILAGITLIILGTIAGLVDLGVHVKHVVACQAQQNDAFRDVATQSRASRNTQDTAQLTTTKAEITMLNIIADPTSTPGTKQAAIQSYVAVVQTYAAKIQTEQAARAKNPFPDGNCA